MVLTLEAGEDETERRRVCWCALIRSNYCVYSVNLNDWCVRFLPHTGACHACVDGGCIFFAVDQEG